MNRSILFEASKSSSLTSVLLSINLNTFINNQENMFRILENITTINRYYITTIDTNFNRKLS